MQKTFIIIIIVMFSLSTIGMYIAATGPQYDREQPGQREDGQEESAQDKGEDLPEYLRGELVNVGEGFDATGLDETTVDIGEERFNPTILRLQKGTTVTWKNQDDTGHTVTSDEDSPNGGLDSGTLNKGETYEHTFTETGTYNYYCEFHPATMKAVVEVVE